MPSTLIPSPNLSQIPVARFRTFEFGRGGGGTDSALWTVKTDGGQGLAADYTKLAAAPRPNTHEMVPKPSLFAQRELTFLF